MSSSILKTNCLPVSRKVEGHALPRWCNNFFVVEIVKPAQLTGRPWWCQLVSLNMNNEIRMTFKNPFRYANYVGESLNITPPPPKKKKKKKKWFRIFENHPDVPSPWFSIPTVILDVSVLSSYNLHFPWNSSPFLIPRKFPHMFADNTQIFIVLSQEFMIRTLEKSNGLWMFIFPYSF